MILELCNNVPSSVFPSFYFIHFDFSLFSSFSVSTWFLLSHLVSSVFSFALAKHNKQVCPCVCVSLCVFGLCGFPCVPLVSCFVGLLWPQLLVITKKYYGYPNDSDPLCSHSFAYAPSDMDYYWHPQIPFIMLNFWELWPFQYLIILFQ